MDVAGVEPAEDGPARPPGVPADAVWLADRERWEQVATVAGQKQGAATQWRPDGTVCLRGRYRDGQLDGPFTIHHPNGQVAREGTYIAGEIDGPMVSYGSDEPTPESLRGCCVPENAWQMKSRYSGGQLLGEVFYDRQGRHLLSDGSLRPDRPPAVPDEADFDEYTRRWMRGRCDERGCWVGAWRFWTAEGLLDEDAEYEDTRKRWSRVLDAQGGVREEVHFEGDGVRHGSYRRRLLAGEDAPWADPRIREERGAFEHGQAVGPWTFHDAEGALVRAVDYGRAHTDSELAHLPAFADEVGSGEGWSALARRLRAGGEVRQAVCAAARAAARDGSGEPFRALLAEVTVPLDPEANERALAALNGGEVTVARALDALLGGADPAAVLRTLASLLKGANRAAHDLVEAAILLAPERRMAYMTRALIRVELGDVEGARADSERVAEESAEAADFLRNYLRVLFPVFDFWPAREPPQSPLEDMPEAPGQPLEAVRRAIEVYATRLALVRAALAERVAGEPVWLPPLPGALLPDGPVALRKEATQIVDETEEGSETTEVAVDESFEASGLGIPALMRMARMQWTALGWLCWSAGLARVALPGALAPPADFPQAAGMIIARYWRAQDAVVTGGLRSMTAGVPSFVWEGMDIDGLPRHLAEIAHDEYLEARAVILFLASPENLSPFQSDLRQT